MMDGKGGNAVFGYVMANLKELEKPRRKRYSAVYCGICRAIRDSALKVAAWV